MDIRITRAEPSQRRPKPTDESALGFGRIFSDHMFLMEYTEGKGWHDARIVPYGPITLDPAAMILHYGQEVFEGLKGYRGTDGALRLFRPEMNIERMNRSTARLCMPQIPVEDGLAAITALVSTDRDWVPRNRGTSLYIRPTMIATEAGLGVRPSAQHLFYIITGPVGAYYSRGLEPVRILVEDKYVRAAVGGVGEAKTSGNYAASLKAAEAAKKKGFDQVLWLDARERRYIEEVGTMNIFFLLGDELVTPPLTGSILPGVTRDTVLRLGREWGLKASERPVTMEEIAAAAGSGALREAFGSGTAAVISPVGSLHYLGKDIRINGERIGDLSKKLLDEITGVQYGDRPDTRGWIRRVE